MLGNQRKKKFDNLGPFGSLGGSTAKEQNEENLERIQEGFPKLPSRILAYGDAAKARTFIGEGKRHLKLLAENMGNAIPPDLVGVNTTPLPNGGEIKCTINYGISTIKIYVPHRRISREAIEEICACCGDCLMIGKLIAQNYSNQYYFDVQVCQSLDMEEFKYEEIWDVHTMDLNHSFAIDDIVLIMVQPNYVSNSDITYPTTSTANLGVDESKMWDMFNCMKLSELADDPVPDLTDNGLNTGIPIHSGNSCNKADGSVEIVSDPPVDPPATLPLYIGILSFTMKECMSN